MIPLKIWRLHPNGCRIESANSSLKGKANETAVKWCAPYKTANSLGFWIYPPTDVDLIWKQGKTFEFRHLSEYNDFDFHFIRQITKDRKDIHHDDWSPPGGRTKFTFGQVESNIVQIWTGCVFQTPPGWNLLVRSPINMPNPHYSVQEGVLETDWMFYDIWINLKIHTHNRWIHLRKDSFPPLAQIIPVQRQATSKNWSVEERSIGEKTDQAEGVLNFWLDYNEKKYASGGKQYLNENKMKDSTTFFRQQKSHCPFRKNDPESSSPQYPSESES